MFFKVPLQRKYKMLTLLMCPCGVFHMQQDISGDKYIVRTMNESLHFETENQS